MDRPKQDPVRELHRRIYGEFPSQVGRAPGRVELLGGVSAIHEGLVLTATIDRHVEVAISRRHDGRVELVWDHGQQRGSCWLHALEATAGEAAEWHALKAVLRQLRRRKVHFSGFSASVHSSIAPGLGMGEEAAFAVAASLAVRRQFPFTLTPLGADAPPRRDERGQLPPMTAEEQRFLARWCAEAWEEAGRFRGERYDPWPALSGKAWHATAVDCRFGTVDRFGLVGEGLVLCDTRVRADGASAERTRELEGEGWAASRALMAKSLRSVDAHYLRANRARLTERQHEVAYHVVGEIQRVVCAERALREEDHAQVGYLMGLSHLSAQEHGRTSWPEADVLVARASSLRGCLGARMIGPGFGGAVVCLVAYHEIVPFVEALVSGYRQETGRGLQPEVLPMADGVTG